MIVYKYKIKQDATVTQGLDLPRGARFLHAGEQYGELYVWCLLPNPDAPTVTRKVYVLATGFPANFQLGDLEHIKFLNTVQMNSGLVWHVFCV